MTRLKAFVSRSPTWMTVFSLLWVIATVTTGIASETAAVRVTDTLSLWDALDALRTRRQVGDTSPAVIEIATETIRLERTIELDQSMVGRGLTLRAAAEFPAVCISGAVPLEVVATDAIHRRYRLPSDWIQLGIPRQLIVDHKLSAPARHPNLGTLRIDRSLQDRRSGFVVAGGTLSESFASDASHADLVFLHDWSSSRLPIASFDAATQTLKTVGPIGCEAPHYAIDHFERQPRFWLEGSKLFADAPGEWWIDREFGEVVMLRVADKEPPSVSLPVLETLLRVTGDNANENFKLVGICFQGTRFPMPPGGLAGAQATMHEPRDASGNRIGSARPMMTAAVHLENVTQATVTSCRFEAIGNTALWIGSRARGCKIQDCKFSDIGGNAINLGEDNGRHVQGQPWFKSAPEQVPTGNQITGCEITRCGQVLPGSVAIWAPLNRSLVIEDNSIRDVPYTGISLGWMWNDSETPAADNVIRDNTIERPMQLLSDGGGIYTLGRQMGTIIEGNDISGIPHAAGRAESNGMFLDEGTTGMTIRGNTIRFVAQSPLRFHKAGKNLVTGNHWELATTKTPEVRLNNTPETNIERIENVNLDRPQRIFLIGNSLTWDTMPSKLDGEVFWHVDCGKNLPYIRRHPESPCVDTSTLWPAGLRKGPFDFVVFQPHYGSTLEQDAAAIEAWLMDQPDAVLVIHTGWARQESLRDELSAGVESMRHNEAYFAALDELLHQKRPELEIRSTTAFKLLAQIDADIRSGVAPIGDVGELYRDAIHMTHELGRPMMHALLRITLGQSPKFEPHASVDPAIVVYIQNELSEIQTTPHPQN